MECPSLHLRVSGVILAGEDPMNPVRSTPRRRFRLRGQLRDTDDLGTDRRSLALLELDRGQAATEVASRLGVSRRAVHDGIDTYRHRPVPRSSATPHTTGRPAPWDEDARAILRGTLHQEPDRFGDQATGWTVPLLPTHLARWGLTAWSDATLRRQLHALGDVRERPRHVLDPAPRRAAKIRRIRRYVKELGPRVVVLFEDETDRLLFPPLRACWALRGEEAEVPSAGRDARRVIFGALNPSNGTRLFLERSRQRAEDFRESLGLIHEHYRGWQVSPILEEDTGHTAKASRREASLLGIRPVRRPIRRGTSPPLPPLPGGVVGRGGTPESGSLTRGRPAGTGRMSETF